MYKKHDGRSDVDGHIFNLDRYDENDYIARFHQTKYSQPAINYKQQYLLIDDDLFDTYRYVSPDKYNLKAYSIKLSSIIKESANLFEIVAKDFYKKLFLVSDGQEEDDLKIQHYLRLCMMLKIEHVLFHALWVYDSTEGIPFKINHPFEAITEIEIEKEWGKFCDHKGYKLYVPCWWKAYAKLKHSLNSLKGLATLRHAILATAAVFLLLNKIYGPGFVDRSEKNEKGEIRTIQVSRLFYIVS